MCIDLLQYLSHPAGQSLPVNLLQALKGGRVTLQVNQNQLQGVSTLWAVWDFWAVGFLWFFTLNYRL